MYMIYDIIMSWFLAVKPTIGLGLQAPFRILHNGSDTPATSNTSDSCNPFLSGRHRHPLDPSSTQAVMF